MPTLVFTLTVATAVLWGGAAIRVWLKPEQAVEWPEDERERVTHRTAELLMRRQLSTVGAMVLPIVILLITLPWLRDVQWWLAP